MQHLHELVHKKYCNICDAYLTDIPQLNCAVLWYGVHNTHISDSYSVKDL